MVIRNISRGICNGTRLQILRIGNDTLTCKVLTGTLSGRTVIISRHRFIYGERKGELGVKFERVQFPIRLAFAMTINKAQGQTLRRVGICLDEGQVFSHGQLYVALSRVTSLESFKVLTADSKTRVRNIVYQQILDPEDLA
jgi:ATP-dependent exoDNAse (exonuclease V) alpha subunit